MEQQILDLHSQGNSVTNIAKIVKKRKSFVSEILKKNNVKHTSKRGGSRKNISQETEFEILTFFQEGKTFSEIGNILNISYKTVEKYCRKHDIYDTRFPDTTDEQKEQINQLYKSGLSSRAVADKLNLSKTTVLEYLDEAREPSSFRIYSVDEDYFENIDSKEKAYWLGVLYADGYNSEDRGNITLGQAEKDKELIYKFKQTLHSEHPVVKQERDNRQDFYSIVIGSKKLSTDLAKYGCIQNKTFKAKFPNISKEYYSHFIRGYFDGDGSIGLKNKQFSITGNIDLLEKIQLILMEECKLGKTKLVSRRKNDIVDIRYGGLNQIRRIYNYLYKDATTYLLRKYNIFNKLLNTSLDDNR